MQFVINAPQMAADGVESQIQGGGDFLVAAALGQQFNHVALAPGKIVKRRGFAVDGAEVLDDDAGDASRHGRGPGVDFLNGFQNARRRRALERVAAGPGEEELENQFGVLVHCQHKDLQFGHDRFSFAHALDAGDDSVTRRRPVFPLKDKWNLPKLGLIFCDLFRIFTDSSKPKKTL